MTKSQIRALAKEWGCTIAEAQQRVREAEQATRSESFKKAFNSFEGRYIFSIRHLKDGLDQCVQLSGHRLDLAKPLILVHAGHDRLLLLGYEV